MVPTASAQDEEADKLLRESNLRTKQVYTRVAVGAMTLAVIILIITLVYHKSHLIIKREIKKAFDFDAEFDAFN